MNQLLKDLAKVKATFQLLSVLAAMEVPELAVMDVPEVDCSVCGLSHRRDAIPFTCETGDGV